MQRIPYSPSKLRGPSGSTPADRTLLFLPGRQEEWKMPSRFSTKCKVCSQSFLQCSCKICSHLEEEKAVEKSIPSRCPWASPLLMAEQRPATARRWQCCGVRTVIWRAREWGHKYRVILHVPGVLGGTWRQDHRHLPVSAQVFVVAWGSEMTASCSWFSGIISLSYYQLQIFYCLHCWIILLRLPLLPHLCMSSPALAETLWAGFFSLRWWFSFFASLLKFFPFFMDSLLDWPSSVFFPRQI